MPGLDVRTLAIFLSLTNFILVLAFLVQYRFNRNYAGLGWWTCSAAALTSGLVFSFFRDNPAIGKFAVIAGNALFVGGIMLLYVGVLRFVGRREPRELLWVSYVVYVLVTLFFTYVNYSPTAQVVLFSVLGAFSFLLTYTLFRYRLRGTIATAHLLAAVFLVNGIFYTLRVLLEFVLPNSGLDFTFLQVATYTLVLLSGIIWTIGSILMINQRLNAESAEREERYRALFQDSPDAYLILTDGVYTDCNRAAEELLRRTKAEIVGKAPAALSPEMQPDGKRSADAAAEKIQNALTAGTRQSFEWLHLRADDSNIFVEVSLVTTMLDGKLALVALLRDITRRKWAESALRESETRFRLLAEKNTDVIWQLGVEMEERERAENALRASEARYRLLAENTTDVIWVIDPETLRFLFVSPSAQELLAYSPEQLKELTFVDLLTPDEQDAQVALLRARAENFARQSDATVYRDEVTYRRADGTPVWAETTSRYYWNETNTRAELQGITRDITERKHLENKLQEQATTDALTGVINRRYFLEMARVEMKHSLWHHTPFALALIDLDNFKQVNDTYGHAAGDAMLVHFTKICKHSIRQVDVLARFGGDEFALLMPATDCAQSYAALERLRANFAATTLQVQDLSLSITISAGIAIVHREQDTFDQVMERADRALYTAKGAGRNCVMVSEADCGAFPKALSRNA